jgi:hypothetical protein
MEHAFDDSAHPLPGRTARRTGLEAFGMASVSLEPVIQ